jgi:hypothetical protein
VVTVGPEGMPCQLAQAQTVGCVPFRDRLQVGWLPACGAPVQAARAQWALRTSSCCVIHNTLMACMAMMAAQLGEKAMQQPSLTLPMGPCNMVVCFQP